MTCECEKRVFNFSAGPAVLPLSALKEAQRDLVCYPGAGASVMELSHRGKVIDGIIKTAEARLRRLLNIPDNYYVMFLQGGATTQFSMVPVNFLGENGADYLEQGTWSKKAAVEARRVGNVNVVWSGKDSNYSTLPQEGDYKVRPEASYFHVTSNETIHGIEFHREPASYGVPMVCDSSSDFLSRPMDVTKYGLIYAGAQKNVGPAGVTLSIMSDDFYKRLIPDEKRPIMMNYKTHVENHSLYNTCPVFAIYMVGLVLKWLEEEIGGLDKMYELNKKKAALLYKALDESNGFYAPHAAKADRSLMNVTWRLPSEDLDKKFAQEAEAAGMIGLKGHRSVGGIRASIYNAFPYEGVERLVEFMADFQRRNA